MAEITPDQLKEILRLHAAWVRNDPAGVRADLTDADLSGIVRGADNPDGVDLRGASMGLIPLRGADLHGADLQGAIFYRGYLPEANLDGCNLEGAILTRANLTGATFREANLSRALLDKIAARGTIFTRAKLRHTLVREADVKNADFWRADLFRCNFNGSDLRGADFRRAEIVGVDFRDADLRGAHFEKSAWPLWCGTRRTRVDRGIASMLAYQLYCLNCDDPDFLLVKLQIAPFAQTFPWQDRPGENDIGPEEHPALQTMKPIEFAASFGSQLHLSRGALARGETIDDEGEE